MKVLIHGMQSSGATLFSCILGQDKKSIVVPDVWSNFSAPKISRNVSVNKIVVKTVVTERFDIRNHKKKFDPDVSILFIRHPVHNIHSLRSKGYKNDYGNMKNKLEKVESIFRKREKYFDITIHYEDMFYDKKRITKK